MTSGPQDNAARADAPYQAGVRFHQQHRLAEAETRCQEALDFNPLHYGAAHLLGIIALQRGEFARGAERLERAIALNPNDASAHYNRGFALASLRQHDIAVGSYDRAISLQPAFVDAHYNRGVALEALNRRADALASYDRVIALKPNHPAALNNRGNVLRELWRLDEAAESYREAIRLLPGQGLIHKNLGMALSEMRRHEEALASYETAMQLEPNQPYLRGIWLHTRMRTCNWQNLDELIADLLMRIERGEPCSPSFPVLALTDSPARQQKAAALWTQSRFPANNALGALAAQPKHERIRIGYFSMDFHDHAVAFQLAGAIEAHDRSRFGVVAFSYGVGADEPMRKRLEKAFDTFIDVRSMSDGEAADLARRMQIDIAVDLGGHTGEARTGILAHRVAPIQVNYLGHPGTMAADYVDYILVDKIVAPAGEAPYFSEKIVHLPHCYQANDDRRVVAAKEFTRAELGLPDAGFVYCCFNNSFKIHPRVFDAWMRILTSVPGSVLWLFEENGTASDNLRKEATRRGVDPQRLVFARHLSNPEHLARLRHADLVLDTLPYNAHTTASDALWVEVPVLTRRGHAFAARVAASLLTAIGLPELITETLADYEGRASQLATDRKAFDAIKRKLAENRLTSPLFDTALFTRHLEAAYREMYDRHLAGLGRQPFAVADDDVSGPVQTHSSRPG